MFAVNVLPLVNANSSVAPAPLVQNVVSILIFSGDGPLKYMPGGTEL